VGEPPLDRHRAQEVAHELADRAVAERDQRAVILVDEGNRLLTAQPVFERAGERHRLLIRRLRPGRHRPVAAGTWTRRTVADREDVGLARGLQRRQDDELVRRVGLQAVNLLQEVGRLHAGRPDPDLRRYHKPARHPYLTPADLDHPLARAHAHPQLLQLLRGRLLKALGQCRQNGWCCLDQGDLHVALGVDAVEPIGNQPTRRLVQLGRQLDAGGTGTDDRHLELLLAQGGFLILRPQAGVQELLLDLLGLVVGVEEHAMLLHSQRAEVVADPAQCDHQRVIADRSSRYDLLAIGVEHRGEQDFLRTAIEPLHPALLEAEAVMLGVRQVDDIVRVRVERAGRHLVQEGLPHMREIGVDQGDPRLPLPTQAVAQLRRQDQATGPTTDNDDVVEGRRRCRIAGQASTCRRMRLGRRGFRSLALVGRHGCHLTCSAVRKAALRGVIPGTPRWQATRGRFPRRCRDGRQRHRGHLCPPPVRR
jgi:hypothetical protein